MKIKRSIAALASMAMLATAAAAAVPMSAGAATYNDVLGKKNTDIQKYLIMDIDANVPNAGFTFDITKYDSEKAAAAALSSSASVDVYNGVDADKITASVDTAATKVITFAPTDSATVETNAESDIAWATPEIYGDEKCSTKSLTYDFSAVGFTTPGVYRYLITETGAVTNKAITNDIGISTDTNKTYRTLDVVVHDYSSYYDTVLSDDDKLDTDKYPVPEGDELYISTYILYAGKYDAAPSDSTELAKKSYSYTNKYTTYDLTIGKDVDGNQASKDKYFAVTVSISDAVAGTKYAVSYFDDENAYTIDGSNAEINVSPNSATTCFTEAKTQPTELTVGADGTVERVFYLKHNQRITVRGLAEGTAYTVSENAETYTASVTPVLTASGASMLGTSYTVNDAHDQVTVSKIVGDNSVIFTNTKTGLLPTGILVSVAGPAVVGIIALLGIAVLLIRGRRRRAEEE